MAIDLLNLQPTAINKSLSGKTLLLAGEPKIGKSEFCASSPDTLIFDFENGYNAHPGVFRVPITKWSELKMYLRDLKKPELQQKFHNIAIDTLAEAWDLCTAFICAQNGVQSIRDIPFGQGYNTRDTEFANFLRDLLNLNYGLILVCHLKEKPIEGSDATTLQPDLDKRCLPIVNGLVDIIGIISQEWDDKGESKRYLLTKSTPYIKAGSRWPNLAPKIPFGYKYLEQAIADAIDDAEKSGAQVVEKPRETVETLDFKAIRTEALELWNKLVGVGENANADMAKAILKKAEIIFGHPIKLSEITEDQVDLFNLVLMDMKDLNN